MRRILIGLSAVLAMTLAMGEAEAARLGGGRSLGMQRSTVTRSAPAPARQAQPAGQQTAPAQPAAAPQPAGGLGKWGPLLGGLAIGGLLGALFGGSGFGGVLLLGLAALAGFMVVGALSRRGAGQVQYAGLQESVPVGTQAAPAEPATAKVPTGFDTAAFLRGAKRNFVQLQLANDAGNLEALREFTTEEMYEALAKDVRDRGAGAQQTDVTGLEAELLELASEPERHIASVRFTGLARERAGAEAASFEEVWNLVKPADGSSGWLLAGIQPMA